MGAEYMDKLKEDDEEAYAKQFSQYVKNGVDSESLEAMYEKAHDAIRANPGHTKAINPKASEKKQWGKTKLSLAGRKDKIRQKKASFSMLWNRPNKFFVHKICSKFLSVTRTFKIFVRLI